MTKMENIPAFFKFFSKILLYGVSSIRFNNVLEFDTYKNDLKLGSHTVFQPAKIAANTHDESLMLNLKWFYPFSLLPSSKKKITVNCSILAIILVLLS